MAIEHVIASIKRLEVWNYYPSAEAAAEALPGVKVGYLADATKCEINHVTYGYRNDDPDYWLRQAEAYRTKAEDCRVMTREEFIQAEADQLLSRPLEEITKDQYWYYLEVLPPLKWGNNRGVNSFFMSEFDRGNYTRQVAKMGGGYYSKLVNFRKPETWISFDMLAKMEGSK